MKKKAYVIGSSTSNSLSPTIFNYWFEKKNINAEYVFKEIKERDFDRELELILNEEGVCGFNITIPFKERVIKKIKNIDEHSKIIGAINCATKKEGVWFGKNTDWQGFLKPLKNRITLDKKNIIVIGYGGASKAVIYALQKEGCQEIKVFNRGFKKTKNLKSLYDFVGMPLSNLHKHTTNKSLIINTTPIDVLRGIDKKNCNENSIGYDIVYKPKETSFLSHFKKNKRIYGIDMLIYQAVPCFEEWFGERAVVDKGLYDLLEKKIL